MAPHAGSLTHLALPCRNLDTSTAWYEAHTPLRVVHHRVDPEGQVAWIAEPDRPGTPFVVVLIGPLDDTGEHEPQPILTPFAHLGVELDSREAVDEAAQRGRTAGCLAWEPAELPPPVGYICALADPDGNLVEFSFGQDVAAVVENPPK
ncbi:MAG: glyoxalase [Acidimicrobiaceae bacterium]|jgi:catechol 2,3-dioxygenase-like lactoylglutathione lyase family enzyme|nr:glyoxalase [Acidimicrobiaceae bacterium]MDP7542604.1 VOC family protein [Acidimicrobiales bacterium]